MNDQNKATYNSSLNCCPTNPKGQNTLLKMIDKINTY